jgi:hypothetical protein
VLWHNTVVAKKTGKQLLVSKPPERVFLKKSMNPGLRFPSRVSGSWNFASVFMDDGEAGMTCFREYLDN